MFARNTTGKIPAICRQAGSAAATLTAAIGVFVLAVSAPVSIDLDGTGFDVVASNAVAQGKGGGGKGGGNAGGGPPDHSNAGGKGGKGGNTDSNDRERLLLMTGEPTVSLAVFTTEIKKRRPANEIEMLDNPHQAVSFYSELYAMEGKKITHRWSHKGSEKFSTSFDVMAQRWRVWSTQLLPADHIGMWTVDVIDQDGKVLETRTLDYRPKGVANIAQN